MKTTILFILLLPFNLSAPIDIVGENTNTHTVVADEDMNRQKRMINFGSATFNGDIHINIHSHGHPANDHDADTPHNAATVTTDGGWSDWSDFGSCSATCGPATKRRERTCTVPAPVNGGKQCSGPTQETADCDLVDCVTGVKIDCSFNSFERRDGYRWDNNIIPYYFTTTLEKDKVLFKSVMDMIEEKTCFTFKEKTEAECKNKHSLEIETGLASCDTGCKGYVTRVKNRLMLASLTQVNDKEDCKCKGFILHELMHALGLAHHETCDLIQASTSVLKKEEIFFLEPDGSDSDWNLLNTLCQVTCPVKDDLSSVLLDNNWRTQKEMNTMTEDDKKKQIIYEVEKMTGHTTADLQKRANVGDFGSLTAIANMAAILLKYSIWPSSTIKTVTYETHLRKTIISETSKRLSIPTNTLEGKNDTELLKTFCSVDEYFGACMYSGCPQKGTQKQFTRCEAIRDGGLTCINPEIKYGTTEGGIPSKSNGENYDEWCEQLVGLGSKAIVTYGARDCAAPRGRLVWGPGGDEPASKWKDSQDERWKDGNIDGHSGCETEGITSVTCKIQGHCVVNVGASDSNIKEATVAPGCVCPDMVNKDDKNGHEFRMTQVETSLAVENTDGDGWTFDLHIFTCLKVCDASNEVLQADCYCKSIDRSSSNSESKTNTKLCQKGKICKEEGCIEIDGPLLFFILFG